jgi:hypothetical protein
MRVDSRYFNVFKNAGGKFCSSYPLYFVHLMLYSLYPKVFRSPTSTKSRNAGFIPGSLFLAIIIKELPLAYGERPKEKPKFLNKF